MKSNADDICNKSDNYCLPKILSKCKDFKEELCQLQYIGQQLGSIILITPKFHAEMAGEGIE